MSVSSPAPHHFSIFGRLWRWSRRTRYIILVRNAHTYFSCKYTCAKRRNGTTFGVREWRMDILCNLRRGMSSCTRASSTPTSLRHISQVHRVKSTVTHLRVPARHMVAHTAYRRTDNDNECAERGSERMDVRVSVEIGIVVEYISLEMLEFGSKLKLCYKSNCVAIV